MVQNRLGRTDLVERRSILVESLSLVVERHPGGAVVLYLVPWEASLGELPYDSEPMEGFRERFDVDSFPERIQVDSGPTIPVGGRHDEASQEAFQVFPFVVVGMPLDVVIRAKAFGEFRMGFFRVLRDPFENLHQGSVPRIRFQESQMLVQADQVELPDWIDPTGLHLLGQKKFIECHSTDINDSE